MNRRTHTFARGRVSDFYRGPAFPLYIFTHACAIILTPYLLAVRAYPVTYRTGAATLRILYVIGRTAPRHALTPTVSRVPVLESRTSVAIVIATTLTRRMVGDRNVVQRWRNFVICVSRGPS